MDEHAPRPAPDTGIRGSTGTSRGIPPGFALPATVMGLALLALLTATGFLVSWLEVRSSSAFGAGTAAFYTADAGLATALAAPPAGGPLTVSVGPAVADVRFERLLELGIGETLVRVASEGSVVVRGVRVTRGVSRVAWVGDPPRPAAALLVGDTLGAATATGTISGLDACAGAPVAGVAGWRPVAPGGGLVVLGVPAMDTIPATVSVAALTGIRWNHLVSSAGPVPDAVVPPDPWPVSSPVFVRFDGSGPLGPGASGTGTLVVAGDLTLAHGFRWTGLVLVGGSLTVAGDVVIRGAVATGLDPGVAGIGDLGTGRVDLTFDSCAVAAAAARLAPLPAAIPGTWRERW